MLQWVLQELERNGQLVDAVKSLYKSNVCLQVDVKLKAFRMHVGLQQCCILSLFFFIIFMYCIVMCNHYGNDVTISRHSEGDLQHGLNGFSAKYYHTGVTIRKLKQWLTQESLLNTLCMLMEHHQNYILSSDILFVTVQYN